MKKIKNLFIITVWLATIVLLTSACNDDLDVYQAYTFELVTMPIQKKIVQGETAEIRCEIIKEGHYMENRFAIRYFQPDGKGELRLDDGTVFKPNDLYPLDREVFRLYYTSFCSDAQSIDVYIIDSFGQTIQRTFSFANDNGE